MRSINFFRAVGDDSCLLCLSDRFRTMINVLGDALAAGIMAHLCKKDFEKAAAATGTSSSAASSASKERVRKISLSIICGNELLRSAICFPLQYKLCCTLYFNPFLSETALTTYVICPKVA